MALVEIPKPFDDNVERYEKISNSVQEILLKLGLTQNESKVYLYLTILDSAKNSKKTLYRDEHLTIQELIHNVFEVIRHDRDFEIIFPTIVSYLGIIMPKSSLEK